jgi:hypothetical protein
MERGASSLTNLLLAKKKITGTLTHLTKKGVIMEDLNLCGRDWKGGY